MTLNPKSLAEHAKFEVINDSAVQVVVAAIRMYGESNEVTPTLAKLGERMRRSTGSLTLLFTNNPNSAEEDGASILRTIYDVHAQMLYILQDPKARAKDYRDFYLIEWHRLRNQIDHGTDEFLQQLARSPRREHGESINDANFRKAEARFRKPKGGHHLNWYRRTLAEIAREVGYEGEWLTLSRLLNPTVHSSAFGLMNRQLNGTSIIELAWTLLHRCMGRTAEYMGVMDQVSGEVTEHFLKPSYKPLLAVDEETLRAMRREMM